MDSRAIRSEEVEELISDMPQHPLQPTFWKNPSTIALVVANCIPVLGVFFFDWDVFQVVLVYWLENVVIGGFTILKLLATCAWHPAPANTPPGQEQMGRVVGGLFLIPFFTVHYGMFTFVHGIFLLVFFRLGIGLHAPSDAIGEAWADAASFSTLVALLGLVAEHGQLFVADFLRPKKYLSLHPVRVMFSPYPHIVVLHVAILAGAFPFVLFRVPSGLLVILIAMKTGLDLWTRSLAGKLWRTS